MENFGNVPGNWKPAQPEGSQPPGAASQPKGPQKPEKKKTDKKALLLTGLLIVLGFVVAKFVFDFVTAQVAGPAKDGEEKKSGLASLVKIVPSGSQGTAASGQKTEQPLAAIKKKIDHTITPFELNGIFLSEGSTCAIINNKIVQVGDTIDGALVEDIQADFVKLNSNGKTIKLLTRTTKK